MSMAIHSTCMLKGQFSIGPPRNPFYIPRQQVHSLTVKGRSFSKFRHSTISSQSQKVSPHEFINDAIAKALKSLQRPAVTAITVALLLMCDPNSAIAASGGRMSFSRFSSSSKSSSTSSDSTSRASYSGFSTSSSKSYSEPDISSRTSYSVSNASSSKSDSKPYTCSWTSYLVPRWRRYSEPDASSWTSCSVSVSPKSSHDIGFGGSKVYFIMAGLTMSALVSMLILVPAFLSKGGVVDATRGTSVLKLQVGLLDKGRSLQKDLDHVAEVADSLSFVLTALLRHPDCCISGYSCVDLKQNIEDCEIHFNQQCIEERGKFDEETLVNVNGIKKQLKMRRPASEFNNGYIVITILVAAEGVRKLPTINNSGDLKEALQKLGSIPTNKILAVEVLWTPQSENEALTEQELLEDDPLLRPF